MQSPLFLDLSHTSHTRARTGVQRVSRALAQGLSDACTPVTYDPYRQSWRTLEPWEEANLRSTSPATARGTRWPLAARLRGEWRHMRQGPASLPAAADGAALPGVIVPEIFSPE